MLVRSRLRLAVFPAWALEVLGLESGANLEDARRAHRGMVRHLHPDLDTASRSQEEYVGRHDKLIAANAAREAIERASTQTSNKAQSFSGVATRQIHAKAAIGDVAAVLDAVAFGVDPNVATPAHGAPPIFYACCADFLGGPQVGLGDEARCKVLELLASMPSVDLSIVGRAKWAEQRNVFDLVSLGRCPIEARKALLRGQAQRSMIQPRCE